MRGRGPIPGLAFDHPAVCVTLYVDARGLTTGLMVVGHRGLEIRFDFVSHELVMLVSDGTSRRMALDRVMYEAYSDEVSSAGYWPGGADVESSAPTRPDPEAVALRFFEQTHRAAEETARWPRLPGVRPGEDG